MAFNSNVKLQMNRQAVSTAIILCLVLACAVQDRNVLRQDGLGSVGFGSSLESVERMLGENVQSQIEDPGCAMVSFKAYPGVLFMVENGVLTRADVSDEIPNILGIEVGDNLSRVLAAYPEVQVEPHKYAENGHYLTFPSADRKLALIFEESDGIIMGVRGGLQPSVSYVEHCL